MQFVRLPLFNYNSVDLMSNSIRQGYLPNNNTGRVDFLDGSHLLIFAPAVIRHVLLVSLSQPMKAIAVNIRQSRPDSMNEEEYPQAPSLHRFHEILAVQTAFRFAMTESNGSLSKWSLTMFICSTLANFPSPCHWLCGRLLQHTLNRLCQSCNGPRPTRNLTRSSPSGGKPVQTLAQVYTGSHTFAHE